MSPISKKTVVEKLEFDATKLFEALKYQIHVAIEYCHSLEKDGVLWIEVFGDIAIDGESQTEVKLYSDDLTDGHENFWNTLNNWLKPKFNHAQYANLILLTSQKFGALAKLKHWSTLDVESRLRLLQEINKVAEKRFEEAKIAAQNKSKTSTELGSNAAKKTKKHTPSKALVLQRKVLSPGNRDALFAALPKIQIITGHPDLSALVDRYKVKYLKGVEDGKKDNFINDLFGYITGVAKITGGWSVAQSEFDKKFGELTAKYITGTLKFPRLNMAKLEKHMTEMEVGSRPFALKIVEIGGNDAMVLQAAGDLVHAEQYIAELIKDFSTSQEDIIDYRQNHLRMHCSSRFGAMLKCANKLKEDELKQASCEFYFERCGEDPSRFSSYDFTPIEFRNGIYHMLANEEPVNPAQAFFWRLWK